MTNAGVYLALVLYYPEFVFSSVIASAGSSVVGLFLHRLFGLRPNVSFGRDIPFILNGLALSEGIRPAGEMLFNKLLNFPNIGIIAAAIMPPIAQTMLFFDDSNGRRSEERRVWNECRSRWSLYH